MPRRSSSARLIGRDRELADLVEAVQRDDPERRVVLVEGEAGIGKSRLLVELVARLQWSDPAKADDASGQGTRVVRGSCIQLGDGELPFAPVLEILDALRGDPAVSVRVKRLRAQLAGAGDQPGTTTAVMRTSRFLEIHDLLVEVAGRATLVVIIDDLHWADQSTLELVRYLAHRLRGSRIALVAAYRSDELHRRHPLRPVLAELGRGLVRDRIELGPLGADDVVTLIGVLGGELPADIAVAIATQAEGNPFHVEELVALDHGSTRLPASLRDVLLARLASVDPAVVAVLGACAIIGRDVDERLLAAVTGLDAAIVAEAVATAVDRSILVPLEDRPTYRFRHALLAEAVREDLLPSARVDLHRRAARVLRDRPDLRSNAPTVAAAELALHLDRAGDIDGAIDAYLEAATLAFRAVAWTEGATAFDRALELAAQARGSAGGDPRLLGNVVRAAFAFHWSGDTARSLALLRDWVEIADLAGDLVSAVSFRMTLARILNDIGEEAASRDQADEAGRILPPDEHTPGGLDVLIGMSNSDWIGGRNRSAIALAERAVAGAEEQDDPALLVSALVSRGTALVGFGHTERGLADFRRIDAIQNEYGWLDDWGWTITNVGASLQDAGLLDLALEVWLRGQTRTREFDKGRSWDPWNLPGLAMCHVLAGRWHDADGPIAEARTFLVPGMPTTWRELAAAELAAGRGDLDGADQAIELAFRNAAELVGDFPSHIEHARASREEAAGDPALRLEHLEAGIRMLEGLDDVVVRSRFAAEAAGAAADITEGMHRSDQRAALGAMRERAAGHARLAADIAAGRLVPGSGSTPWLRANAQLAAAEAGRAGGHDDPAAWPELIDTYDRLGMRPIVGSVRFRLASALLHAGDRNAATEALREAHALATKIGMTVLSRRITALARAGRLSLETATEMAPTMAEPLTASDSWRLSVREREVLALVAAGRTNGEIGAALFISTKTASVHVTHILDKLGVSSRTEAALLASRATLSDDPDASSLGPG